MPTSDRAVQKIASDLIKLEKEQRRLATATRLTHSSIDNGALPVKDADGNVRSVWGVQADGTVATVYTNGPTPGVPSAPTLVAHQIAVTVQWDGSFETGDAPKDLHVVEVHVSETVDADGKFVPSTETLTGTLPPGGGAVTFAGDNDIHYVCLVAVSTSGVKSEPSDIQSVTPLPANAVIADEIVGVTVTGGILRTAATGARVEINADESTQDVQFISANGEIAVVAQQDFAGAEGSPQGPGIALDSPVVTDATDPANPVDRSAHIALAANQVELSTKNVTDPANPVYLSSITCDPGYVQLLTGTDHLMLVQPTAVIMKSGGSQMLADASTVQMKANSGGSVNAGNNGVTLSTPSSGVFKILPGAIQLVNQDDSAHLQWSADDGAWEITGAAFRVNAPLVHGTTRAYKAAATDSPALTTTTTAVPGAAITFSTTLAATVLLVTGAFDMSATGSGGTLIGFCYVDGVEQSAQAIFVPAGSNRLTAGQSWLVTIPAGGHTIDLRARATSGAQGPVIHAQHTTITGLIVSGG